MKTTMMIQMWKKLLGSRKKLMFTWDAIIWGVEEISVKQMRTYQEVVKADEWKLGIAGQKAN